jgi:hypothetical protein
VVVIGGRGDTAQVVAVDGGGVEKEWLCLLMRTYVAGKRRLRGSVKEKDVAYVTLLRNIKMRHQSLCFHV